MASWLRDAHNYPEVMDFDLDPQQAEAVVDIQVTAAPREQLGARR